MAHGDHPNVDLHDGDTVIFSATPIPGNERAVNETIDRIYRLGASVITRGRRARCTPRGTATPEELKLMLNLTKPRYVMPVHGDHKRLRLHARAGRGRRASRRSRSSAARTACRSRSTRPGRALGRARAGRADLRGRHGGGRHRGRGAARPPHALGGRHLHRRRHDLRAGRPLGRRRPRSSSAACPSWRRRTPSWTSCARRSTTRSRTRPRSEITEIDLRPGPPARRRGRVRLRAPEAAPDDPAGGRRGLAGDLATPKKPQSSVVPRTRRSRAGWRTRAIVDGRRPSRR